MEFDSTELVDKGLKQVVVVVDVVATVASRFINYSFFPSMNLLMRNSF